MTLCKYWHALPRRSGEIRAAKVEQERLLGQPGNTGAAVPGPSPALGSCQGRVRAGKTGRKDHGWHRMQNVGTVTRTCNGTWSVPGQNVPAGFSWTSSTLQGKSYVLLLLSWYFILALGASELIKRPFRKRLKLSLKSQGECIVFFSSQALSAMH